MQCDNNKQNDKINIRFSNFELLRILAMFMIVIYHIIDHCVIVQLVNPALIGREMIDYFNHPVFHKWLLILDSLKTFGIIANAEFILISGFFSAHRKLENIKLVNISKKLLLQMGFASIFLVFVSTVVHFIKPDIFISMQNISSFNSTNWFVGYYFVIVLTGTLFLNKFLIQFDCERYAVFLIILFTFIQLSYSGELAESLISGSRTVLNGIFLYSLGGFIRKFNPFKNVRIYVFFVLSIFVYILIWLSSYNVTETNIQTCIRNGATDSFIQSVSWFPNYSIVIMILSICLFEVFRRIRLSENKSITFLGQATFMVYLIHDNSFFYEIWNLKDWITIMSVSPLLFCVNILKSAMITFVFGVLVYILYIGTMVILRKGRVLIIKNS